MTTMHINQSTEYFQGFTEQKNTGNGLLQHQYFVQMVCKTLTALMIIKK